MAIFEIPQLPHQGVVLGVGDLGLVQDMVEMLMPPQFAAQLIHFTPRIFHGTLNYNLNEAGGENTITEYRSTVLIYNPRAGKFGRSGTAILDRAVQILKKNGHTVTVAPTTGPATAGAIAREHIAAGADLIVAAGGDGTINEIVEGMVHSHVPLAILPAGTANVLAMEMKLGSRMERVAERLEECQPYRIPVGRLTCDGGRVSRHFMLMAGIGLDAHIVYNVNGAIKARIGKLAYWVAGWSLLGKRLVHFTAELSGSRRECSFALITKVRNYGGDFEIARNVSLFDDEFEVVLLEGRSTIRYVKYFAGMASNCLTGMKGATVLRSDRVTLTNPEGARIYVQIDGEFAGHLPAEVGIVPDALTLLIPPEYSRASNAPALARGRSSDSA
jgi:diacylglycerol kinase (ATP)